MLLLELLHLALSLVKGCFLLLCVKTELLNGLLGVIKLRLVERNVPRMVLSS